MDRSQSVLITGAAGFIGSHLCEKLLKHGYQIVGVDNLNDYYDPSLKKYNLTILETYDDFHFHKIDIRNFTSLKTIFKQQTYSAVMHLAAQAGVRYSITNPFLYQEVNFGGTLSLLFLAQKYQCSPFIFASSSSVYGNQDKVPFTEQDKLDRPTSVYAATKIADEALCRTYAHLYKMDITCLRFFTVYGPRGRPDMAPHIFTSKLLHKEKIQLFAKSEHELQRDFSYISDIVEGIYRTLEYRNEFEIFNLAYGSPVYVIDFIETLADLTGQSYEIEYIDRQQGDVTVTYADISKVRKYLGYSPQIDAKDGLRKYVKWFQESYMA